MEGGTYQGSREIWNSEYLENLEPNCGLWPLFYNFVVEKLDLHMCCHYDRGVMVFKQTARLL